jgi:hypothetical protein
VTFVNCSNLCMTSVLSVLVQHLFVVSICDFGCMSTKLFFITVCILNSKVVVY